jgi:N6-L-threonylcarbamoyladenine synthase
MQGAYDFSFSGLKTAVLRAVQREVDVDTTFPSFKLPGLLNDVQRADFAASFQRTAVETLVDKAETAFKDYSPASVVIAGGVAANKELRRVLQERLPLNIEYAPMQLCTDNAAMIATLGYFYSQKVEPTSPLVLEIQPSLSMTKTSWATKKEPQINTVL